MTAFTGRREMQVTEDDFDADPHLLNTPIGIVDLREASLHEHDSERLMRCMTAVAPDMALILQCTFGGKKWPDLIPLFWRAVENIAREPSDPDAFEKGLPLGAIRPNYIGVTSRWLGYSLSGWRWHQHLMFVQGWPGVGKTQVYEAFLMLIGDYGVVLPDTFLLKTDEGKRFDLMQIVGKRFGFFDETRMGSTFYETRASKVVGSEMLAGEIKGGRVNVPFKNVTKLSLVGNHKPHFHSGETGGLATRLLLFEAGGRGFRNKPGD
jgi:putative DNA primase/helicase